MDGGQLDGDRALRVEDVVVEGISDGAAASIGHDPGGTPFITVVVITRGPSLQLARFLRSLGHAEGLEHAEVLIGLNGGSRPNSMRRLVERYLPGARVELRSLPHEHLGAARNRLVVNAAAPLVLFLDDDVEVPPEHLLRMWAVMQDAKIAAAGGPNLTPPTSTEFERLAGRVLASPIGTGPLRHRYRSASPATGRDGNLIGAVLGVRRSALGTSCFDPTLRGAEENELLVRLRRKGGIVHDPKLAVFHHRRGTLPSHLQQMFKYGSGRGEMLVRAFSLSQLKFTLPALALGGFLLTTVLAPRAAVFVAFAYTGMLIAEAFRLARPRRAPTAFLLLAGTHIAYALGTTKGALAELGRLRSRGSSA